MTKENDDILIQQYLQGDLEPMEKAQLEARLESDRELKALLDQYRSMVSELDDLSRYEMPADLWRRTVRPAMATELGLNESWGAKFSHMFAAFRSLALNPVVVAVAFVTIIVGVTFLIQQQFMSEPPPQPYEKALAEIERLRKDFVSQLDVLMQEMETRKSRMNPELRAVYEETLTKVDEAIADAERFYALYSDEHDAIEMLLAAYDRKTAFLKRFIDLADTDL